MKQTFSGTIRKKRGLLSLYIWYTNNRPTCVYFYKHPWAQSYSVQVYAVMYVFCAKIYAALRI